MSPDRPNRVAKAILEPHTIVVGDDDTAGVYCDRVAEWVALPEDHPDTPVRFCMFCGVELKRRRVPSDAMKR